MRQGLDKELSTYFGEDNIVGKSIMKNKYLLTDESFTQFVDRVSIGNLRVKQLIDSKRFMPGGRILAHIGDKTNRKTTLSNCYVIPAPKDDVDSIFNTCAMLGNTYKMGGGCGIDLSFLRPRGSSVNNAAKTSTGAVSFMEVFETATKVIGQNGRRGALMMMLDGDHADAQEFIDVKASDASNITSANISLRVSDNFIKNAKLGKSYSKDFSYKSGGSELTKSYSVNPEELLNKVANNAWKSAEPGILFWDTITKYNLMQNQPDFKIAGTNPCGK